MATRTDHVIVRDGSNRRGGPPPAPPARPAKAPPEAKTPADSRYSDPSTVGWFDESEGFKAARGNHPGARGPESEPGGTHQEPGDASIAAAVPLT